jgi:8-oxo-dGTP pyrophosphatase MutT (NUDIX family)
MEVLLLERAARSGFWQSVTGSLEQPGEPFAAAAARELREETGIDAAHGRLEPWNVGYTFEIYQRWRHRFAPGVTHNTERLFSFELPARVPVTLAPQEHTAFAWLPWREAARKCFSWSNRDAILLIGAALVAAGCASGGGERLAPHLESASAEVHDCAQWYRAIDAEIDAAGVRDGQYARVPGFPHLRVDGLHAALRDRAARNDAALRTFAERLSDLDLESRRYELQNLPQLNDDARAAALRRAQDCARLMRSADLASPAAREAMLGAAVVRTDRSSRRSAERDSGGERVPPASRVRYAPPPVLQIPREVVAGLLGRATFDPLHHPALSEREIDRLAAVYAPSFEVEIGGDADRFGRLRWGRAARIPEVDAAQPTVYVQAAYGRYQEHVLLQLVYTIWFGGRLDGVAWRVTLAPDGEPILYDAMHLCGSRHVIFATPRARLRGPAAPQFVLQPLPQAGEGERPVVGIALGAHDVRYLEMVRGADSLVRYNFRFHDELRSLPRAAGRHASVFGPDGVIAGTSCMRRFDDAGLLEQRFELDL